MRERLILALDVQCVDEAAALAARVRGVVGVYKIGLELLFNGGMDLARRLAGEGERVFIDAKLHDIPTTVERAVACISQLGAHILTVHAYPQTVRAALAGRRDERLRLVGVTVLTSMSEADAQEAGYSKPIDQIVQQRVAAVKVLGGDGVVCSPHEAAAARAALGPQALVITPGIRPAGTSADDQSRAAMPAAAIAAGASHIVVGRPISRASDPRAAAEAIVQDMENLSCCA